MKPRFFKTPADFRAWLAEHHDRAPELLVGFYKKDSGKPSITWPESVDEALCFGWIDGVRRRIDDASYSIRFTPRRRSSIWSVVNTKRVAVLEREGRMHEAGLKVFRERDPKKTALYTFEREAAALPPAYERLIRANAKAWAYFNTAAPYYKKLAIYWVINAKREDTQLRRLKTLVDSSASGKRIPGFEIEKKR